jgi:prevent-host-death family protein
LAKWQVNEAKSRFSELLELVETQGPQVITRHGKDKAVVLSIEDYRKLEAIKPDFKEYLLSGPKVDDFEIERPQDQGREIDL